MTVWAQKLWNSKPSLLTVFGLVSFVIVVCIGLSLGWVMQGAVRDRAIADAARTGEVAANLGVRPFLEVSDLEQNFVPLSQERVNSLDESLGASLSPNGIVRIKVWNRQHWLVYSDNPALRSLWFAGADTLEQSFRGQLTTEITDLTAPEEREERDFGELIAVYVPLRSADGETFTSDPRAEIVGAFEIYLPYQPIAADIASDLQKLWAALAAGLVVLYLALFRLVAKASRRLRRQANQNLYLATHDSLTDLLNRDGFVAEVKNCAGPVNKDSEDDDIVILLDLDRFQQINDALGHRVGDELLCVIGRRLQIACGQDAIVGRLGGDEFAVLLKAVSAEKVLLHLDRCAAAITTPIELEGIQIDVVASLGVAKVNGFQAEVVLQHADIAMYAAKSNKSGYEFFKPELAQTSADSLDLASQVRNGIENQNFEVFYQPKYDLATGRISGSEALVRWLHPTRGLVPPLNFFPTVEQLPICRELTNYILERAIRDLAQWKDAWPDIGVSVNLSARDVNDPNLPLEIEALLRRYRIRPELLTVELTEGTVLENQDRTAATLSRIRHLGCGVAIDDFGTGYASISYLVKLPVTELKIDSSFIRDMDVNPQSSKIVRYCVDVGHALGLKTTAEGIETDEIECQLREMGCDIGQGYFVSRPVPLAEFRTFLRQSSNRIVSPIRERHPVGAGAGGWS